MLENRFQAIDSREYWRLLEPGEEILAMDEFYLRIWRPVSGAMIGSHFNPVSMHPVRRRVSPPPTCETCGNSTVEPKMVQQFSSDCDLAPGQPDERVCLVWEAFVPHCGYCHLHPKAQEASRG